MEICIPALDAVEKIQIASDVPEEVSFVDVVATGLLDLHPFHILLLTLVHISLVAASSLVRLHSDPFPLFAFG